MMAARTSDTVIIGDGLVGWALAHELSGRGTAVTVIEGEVPGSATMAAAGMITPGTVFSDNPAYLPLAISAMRHYPHLIDTLEALGHGRAGFSRPGGLVLARRASEVPWLDQVERDLAANRDAGLGMIGDIQRVDPDQCRHLVPVLGPDLAGGIWYAGAAQVVGRDLRSALRSAAISAGATAISGRAHLVRRGELIAVEMADGSRIQPETLIVAAGAWSASLLNQVGIPVPITPQRGQLLHLGWDTASQPWPVIELASHHYLLGIGDRLVVGATRETAGFEPFPTPAGIQDVLTEALAIAPDLASAPILETRVGLRPLSPDGLPLVGRIPQTSNAWLCAGHGPLGLTLGPWTAVMLAQAIIGEEPTPPLHGYRPDRFTA